MGTARYNLPSSNDNNLTPYNSSSTTVVRAVKHNCIKPSNWFLMLYWWLSNAHRFARCMIQSRLWRRSHRIVSPLFFSRQVLEVIILFFEYPRYTWSLQHDADRPTDRPDASSYNSTQQLQTNGSSSNSFGDLQIVEPRDGHNGFMDALVSWDEWMRSFFSDSCKMRKC